jgi:hypothetical protein
MKTMVSGLLGICLGALGMWLYTSNIAYTSDYLSTEISITTTIKQIELLKASQYSELENALISSVPCQIHKYEKLIGANAVQDTNFSNELIEKAKQYSGKLSCPN